MADEKLTPFPNEASRRALRKLLSRAEEESDLPDIPRAKMGLYPLGPDDVVISRALYDLIIVGLTGATPEHRQHIADLMRACMAAPFE